jgi:hypothetical protein
MSMVHILFLNAEMVANVASRKWAALIRVVWALLLDAKNSLRWHQYSVNILPVPFQPVE